MLIFVPFTTTVHKDITERLSKINQNTAREVKAVLDKNKAERHIRGGMATKEKYERERKSHEAHID